MSLSILIKRPSQQMMLYRKKTCPPRLHIPACLSVGMGRHILSRVEGGMGIVLGMTTSASASASVVIPHNEWAAATLWDKRIFHHKYLHAAPRVHHAERQWLVMRVRSYFFLLYAYEADDGWGQLARLLPHCPRSIHFFW